MSIDNTCDVWVHIWYRIQTTSFVRVSGKTSVFSINNICVLFIIPVTFTKLFSSTQLLFSTAADCSSVIFLRGVAIEFHYQTRRSAQTRNNTYEVRSDLPTDGTTASRPNRVCIIFVAVPSRKTIKRNRFIAGKTKTLIERRPDVRAYDS